MPRSHRISKLQIMLRSTGTYLGEVLDVGHKPFVEHIHERIIVLAGLALHAVVMVHQQGWLTRGLQPRACLGTETQRKRHRWYFSGPDFDGKRQRGERKNPQVRHHARATPFHQLGST